MTVTKAGPIHDKHRQELQRSWLHRFRMPLSGGHTRRHASMLPRIKNVNIV